MRVQKINELSSFLKEENDLEVERAATRNWAMDNVQDPVTTPPDNQ